MLEPLHYNGEFRVRRGCLESVWMEFNISKDCKAIGENVMTLRFIDRMNGGVDMGYELNVTVDVIDAELPEQKLILTQWLYCDCLAQYYNVPVWSERHWEVIENFAKVAVKNGINMLLTPVFTPPLDTAVGGERLTTQLVGIKKSGNRYTFNWKLLDRWIEMCNRIGVKYFEISHLFSQCGGNSRTEDHGDQEGALKIYEEFRNYLFEIEMEIHEYFDLYLFNQRTRQVIAGK